MASTVGVDRCVYPKYWGVFPILFFGNNIDIDPNYDNPVFVSFRTYVRNLNIVLEIPRRYALSG